MYKICDDCGDLHFEVGDIVKRCPSADNIQDLEQKISDKEHFGSPIGSALPDETFADEACSYSSEYFQRFKVINVDCENKQYLLEGLILKSGDITCHFDNVIQSEGY